MKRFSWVLLSAVAVCAAAPARADNLLGAYIGAGVGASNVGNNNYNYNYGYNGGFNNNLAWKAIVGIRPLPVIGAEYEYIDFGSNSGNNGYYGPTYYYGPNSHPKASAVFALGYLPLPLPFLDVYGKIGAAHLQTDITSFSGCAGNYPPGGGSCTPASYRLDQSNNQFAFGAGVQTKFQDFAFRAEYERINSSYGNPDAFTVSVTWTF
jgi:hypothetical protein